MGCKPWTPNGPSEGSSPRSGTSRPCEEGNVLICCLRNTHIGNLNELSFDEIWNGREARNYRKGLLEKRPYKHCLDCRLLFPDRRESFENLIGVAQR